MLCRYMVVCVGLRVGSFRDFAVVCLLVGSLRVRTDRVGWAESGKRWS